MTEQISATTIRPDGISILSALYGVYAAITLLSGLALIAFTSVIQTLKGSAIIPLYLFTVIGAVGFVIILAGIILAVVTWGLWNLREWAWLMAVVFSILGLLHFPVGTIINILIIWYLFKPEVKTFFKMMRSKVTTDGAIR